jgi:hypothetical protein
VVEQRDRRAAGADPAGVPSLIGNIDGIPADDRDSANQSWLDQKRQAVQAEYDYIQDRLGWVRISAAGVEFAATGRVPAFLPWPAVQFVSSRLRGPFTDLIGWPTRPDAVTVNPVGSPAPQHETS